MPLIRLRTWIDGPLERCFDAARDMDLHIESVSQTQERAVAGVTTGLIGLGEQVTWEAVHFGVRQQLTAKVTAFDRPHILVDEMVSGAFHSFIHVHVFQPQRGGTLMTDHFAYEAPLGPIGSLADLLFLRRYMARLLRVRAQFLKAAVEAGR